MSLRSTPRLVKNLCSTANELEYMQDKELGLKNEYILLVNKRLNKESLKDE